jgi:hypothetical protein
MSATCKTGSIQTEAADELHRASGLPNHSRKARKTVYRLFFEKCRKKKNPRRISDGDLLLFYYLPHFHCPVIGQPHKINPAGQA